MNSRFVWAVLFLAAAAWATADAKTVAGSEKGPVVALISGAEGTVNLLHEGSVVRGWTFPGPFTSAVILAGPLDTVEWDGDDAVITPAGAKPVDAARQALASSSAPRLILINPDGAAEVLKAPEGEDEGYDAASAASAEE